MLQATYQTLLIWDMFPNNKLHKYQPTVRLENIEPLPDRRQNIVVSRVQIGHTHLSLTHT